MDEQHKATRRAGQGRVPTRQSQTTPPNPIPIHAGRAGMMSCPPPHEHEHEHDHQSRPALELLDEYWFFSNTLANSSNKPPERGQYKHSSSSAAGARRRLLRTPSLPPPGRVSDDLVEHAAGSANQQQQQQDQEVEDDDLNWSSIYEGVLRTRMAEGGAAATGRPRPTALRRAPSMPVPGGPSASTPARSNKPTPSQKQQLARSRSSMFRDIKCRRSSGDLESIEVQGFRDLGFVFDKEDLRDSLAGVLPGLRKPAGNKSRPPALLRVQSEARSAAEVKDQLRMWAQAVACNVRQDC